MQLCDGWESFKYGAARCYALYDKCQGSNNAHCHPHVVWGSKVASGEPSSGHLGQGAFGASISYPVIWAFGVRCVLGLNSISS